MTTRRRLLSGLSAAVLALSAFGLAGAAHAADPLKLGLASPGPLADPIKVAVEEAKAQGIDVEVIEFTDWIAPNEALQNGDIDFNYYQHVPFLENASAARGYAFVSLGVGTSSKLGLYSSKHASFDEIPEDGTVAIANDPVNGGRGLVLLEKAGLIKLKPGLDYKATVADIVENPKNLRIVEVVAQQLPRTLADVDLAQGYAHFLKDYGLDPDSALLFDPIQQRFALQWVVKPDNPRVEDIRKFVAIYQTSPAVRASIQERFGDLIVPAW